jgi:hypothetical protein
MLGIPPDYNAGVLRTQQEKQQLKLSDTEFGKTGKIFTGSQH